MAVQTVAKTAESTAELLVELWGEMQAERTAVWRAAKTVGTTAAWTGENSAAPKADS